MFWTLHGLSYQQKGISHLAWCYSRFAQAASLKKKVCEARFELEGFIKAHLFGIEVL